MLFKKLDTKGRLIRDIKGMFRRGDSSVDLTSFVGFEIPAAMENRADEWARDIADTFKQTGHYYYEEKDGKLILYKLPDVIKKEVRTAGIGIIAAAITTIITSWLIDLIKTPELKELQRQLIEVNHKVDSLTKSKN